MTDDFSSKFDKKRLSIAIHITILVVVFVFIINLIDVSYSRYESSANMNVQASVAVFLVDQGTNTVSIALEGLEPSNEVYTYVINVRNYKDAVRTQVDLDYHIKFETTTNLPITIGVYRNEDYGPNATNIITSTSTRMDGDVYYRVYETSQNYRFHYTANEQDYYTIAINYQLSNQNHPEYQGKIELLSVIITAEQVV